MSGHKRLIEAVNSQPPAPCEGCGDRARCARFGLDCEAFERYANLLPKRFNAARIPSADIFDKVFK